MRTTIVVMLMNLIWIKMLMFVAGFTTVVTTAV